MTQKEPLWPPALSTLLIISVAAIISLGVVIYNAARIDFETGVAQTQSRPSGNLYGSGGCTLAQFQEEGQRITRLASWQCAKDAQGNDLFEVVVATPITRGGSAKGINNIGTFSSPDGANIYVCGAKTGEKLTVIWPVGCTNSLPGGGPGACIRESQPLSQFNTGGVTNAFVEGPGDPGTGNRPFWFCDATAKGATTPSDAFFGWVYTAQAYPAREDAEGSQRSVRDGRDRQQKGGGTATCGFFQKLFNRAGCQQQ